MKILVDADGCPVTKATAKIANEYNIELIIVCDTSHIFNIDNATVITVDKGSDSADFALVNLCKCNDIVITQDYGLAAMALSKQAKVINQNGLIIDNKNIDSLLASRYIAKKQRMNNKHLKGPAKRTNEQDKKFEKVLRRLLDENIDCT